MDVKRSIVAAALGLVVAACETMNMHGGGRPGFAASNQVCKGIGVECQVQIACGNGTCAADPKVLLVDGGAPGQRLTFMLAQPAPGYAFPADAIVFQPPAGAASSDWTCTTAGGTLVNCVAGRYTKGTINVYTGKVTGPAGPVNVDPWVVNN
jgi:hypothetical protein